MLYYRPACGWRADGVESVCFVGLPRSGCKISSLITVIFYHIGWFVGTPLGTKVM